MYCESTAWGRAARALRHPPTLPESAVSVATRAEGGGRRCSVKVKRQTFETRWEKHEGMEGWMDGWGDRYIEGWVIKGCGRVNGELGLIPEHRSQWQIDSRSQTTAASTVRETNTVGIFHSQWQPRSRSWLRGLNHLDTDNVSVKSHSALWSYSKPRILSVLSVRKSYRLE